MKEVILPDYPGYTIFEDGSILATSTKKVFLKPGLTLDGYKQVNVITPLAKNGYRHSIKLHRLVAKAFVPNPHNYTEVNHIDGNKLNNHYTNLEWCTRSHNIIHAYKLGLRNSQGANNASSKIDSNDVLKIRELYNTGVFQKHIAQTYGLTQAQISSIVRRESWSHV